MKKHMIVLGELLLSLALLACGQPSAASAPTAAPAATVAVHLETAAPAVTPEILSALLDPDEEAFDEDDRVVGRCVSVLEELPYAVDLDGDGTMGVLDLVAYTPADEYPRWAVSLTRDGREQRFETDVPCDSWFDLFVGDLDEDGACEIFFHGDTASDDYLIYGFNSDLSLLFFEPDERAMRWGGDAQSSVFDGRIEGFEDGQIIIAGTVDMLGTQFGVRSYLIGEGRVIGPASSVWDFEADDDRALTVTKELTAYASKVRRDPGEAFTLQPGDRIYPLASDGHERIWFRTDKGRDGVLLLTPDEEHMWLIDGTPEAEFFESLPYAG